VLIDLVWILTVVLLPFVTVVVVVYGTDRLAVALSIGTIAASTACLLLLFLSGPVERQIRRRADRLRG
jgi:uncharacterized membrane protein